MSQSVPRDGGYCNAIAEEEPGWDCGSQSVPRDGGYCNAAVIAAAAAEGLNPSRGTGGTATTPARLKECSDLKSQSVPRDGGYCNGSARKVLSEEDMSQSVPRDGGYCNNLIEVSESEE